MVYGRREGDVVQERTPVWDATPHHDLCSSKSSQESSWSINLKVNPEHSQIGSKPLFSLGSLEVRISEVLGEMSP